MKMLTKTAATALGLALVLSALAGTASAGFDVPEIDPGSMGGALTLLVGGVMMLTGRARRAAK